MSDSRRRWKRDEGPRVSATTTRVAELVAEARAATGLEDFGADGWQEGLEVLVRSGLTDARFTEYGEQSFYGSIRHTLSNRLQVEDWFTRHPEIEEQEVFVELLGVGLPRTGSTALAHMLGEDVSVRSLRMWEAATPCPPPCVSPEADEARIAASEAMVEMMDMVAPRMRSMLPQSATGPMEDHDLMSLQFTAQAFQAMGRLTSYGDWLLDCDMEPTYRYERRVLKLLQWKSPPTRWQLKSPTHTLFLDDFEKVFPETRFVMTHRDPSKVIPSVTDVYATLGAMGNVDLDPVAVGEMNLHQWALAVDRCLAFRSAGREDRFYDIAFSAFQAQPIDEIRSLYDWLGRDLTADTEQKMREWWTTNRRPPGTEEQRTDDFGITEESLAARFGAYRARFGPLLG